MEKRYTVTFGNTSKWIQQACKTPDDREPVFFYEIGIKRYWLKQLYYFIYGFTGIRITKPRD